MRHLLARDPLWSSLGRDVLGDLVDACDLVDVPGGTRLVRAGETLDALLCVVHGSLRVLGAGDDRAHTVREFYRGDTLGIMGLVSDRPFPVELYAVRDSTLLRLPRACFVALAAKHPPLLLALAKMMGERAFEVLEAYVDGPAARVTPRGGNLALVSLSDADAVRDVAALLVRAFETERPLTRVSAALVDDTFGIGTAASATRQNALTAWLSQLEDRADMVVYECEPRQAAWTARCLRQSDRVVLVASAADADRLDVRALESLSRPGGLTRAIDLVLVHPLSTRLPSQTCRWLGVPDLRAIHHVRHPGDVARAARRIVGRPTGLVLSGGGARGIAHVGVIAAIADAGIAIDYVCGTSMGAIFAAAVALGLDLPHMRAEVHELFGKPFALYDLTLPISSLLAGKKLDRVLHRQLGDADIEDLWLPFFCVSTDLSRAEMVVHERGCLWKSVRASVSIPGIFPPLPLDGRTLVDGGLVDNLPLDLMLERCRGPIIAVDVFPYGDPGFVEPRNAITRRLRKWRTRWRSEPASPPLFDILVRSTLVGSKVRQREAMSRGDQILYLEPPVASFGTLQWRAHRELFDVGYRYARDALARRVGRQR
ncbi:MAG TPA: cyclic nucleotide-binding and patatin-like phospholipase domain-containing protein [Polyangia bacterium]